MPSMNLDVVDAAELAELLQFLAGWITSDPARLAPSLLAFVSHPAYGLPQLRSDLDRFTFLLGGNDGEPLFQPGPLSALHPTIRPALPLQPVTRNPSRRPNTPRTNTSVHQSIHALPCLAACRVWLWASAVTARLAGAGQRSSVSSAASGPSASVAFVRSRSSMVLPVADAIWSRSARARAVKNRSKSSWAIRSASVRWVETCFLIVSLSTLALLASRSR
jgi:hypothetical protein